MCAKKQLSERDKILVPATAPAIQIAHCAATCCPPLGASSPTLWMPPSDMTIGQPSDQFTWHLSFLGGWRQLLLHMSATLHKCSSSSCPQWLSWKILSTLDFCQSGGFLTHSYSYTYPWSCGHGCRQGWLLRQVGWGDGRWIFWFGFKIKYVANNLPPNF